MYPRVKEFLDGEVEKGKTDGYVKTMFNRIRPIPELKSSNFMQRNFGERVAMNSRFREQQQISLRLQW